MKRTGLTFLFFTIILVGSVSTAVPASGENTLANPAPHALQAASSIVVSSVNFNDSTPGIWTQSGSPTLDYVDDGQGGQALSITRAADYEGIQSPAGLLQADVEYTFSMRAKISAGGPASTAIRFVVKPNYNWVANTTIYDTGWTTLSGQYTLPAGVDPASTQIYIGSTDQTGPYTILIDDILITRPDSGVCTASVTVTTRADNGAGSLR